MEPFQLAFAFSLGLASVMTPCVLPIIPGYLAYLFGKEKYELVKGSLAIFAGISAGGLALGSVMALLGGVAETRWFYLAAAAVLIIIIVMTRANMIRPIAFSGALGKKKGIATGFLFGVLIIFVASPCILPLLAIVAIFSLTVEGTLSRIALLLAYTSGLGIPFVAIGAFSSLSAKLRKVVSTKAAANVELIIMLITLAWLVASFFLS